MTRTISSLPVLTNQQPTGHQVGSKMVHMHGKLAFSLASTSDVNSSYLVSDELNTPEIGMDTEFRFVDSTILTTSTDIQTPDWGDMPPIPINTLEGQQTLPDMLGWSSNRPRPTELKLCPQMDTPETPLWSSPVVPARPAELKLKLQATPLPSLDTPNMTLDTPDVLQQFGDPTNFNLLHFVLNDKANTTLDSPQISTTTSKFEALPVTIKQEKITFVDSPQQYDVTSTSQEMEAMHGNIKYEPLEVPISSVVSEVSQQSRKRVRSRLTSASSSMYQYSEDEDSDEPSCSKRGRRYQEGDEESMTGSASSYKYQELRQRNNEASRRSRQNRKKQEHTMEIQANNLEKENRSLHAKVDRLEHLVNTLRKALLDSISKANKK